MTDYKPEGYTSVAPYLMPGDARAQIEFLVDVFDAEPLRRYDMPDGSVMHAEVRIGDTVVMTGQAGGEWPPHPAHVHVYVEDAEAVYERALARGATTLQRPVRKQGDPELRGGFKDPQGNTWWVATQVDRDDS